MLDTKLPLFQRDDILVHVEYGFEREVATVFEEEDGTFSYECTDFNRLPLFFSEDELLDEYSLK